MGEALARPDHPITLGAAAAVSISLARLGATDQAQTLAPDTVARWRWPETGWAPTIRSPAFLTRVLAPAPPLAGT